MKPYNCFFDPPVIDQIFQIYSAYPSFSWGVAIDKLIDNIIKLIKIQGCDIKTI